MLMNRDKEFSFEQRWLDLEKSRKDLEFHRAEFCRDVRAEFEKGERGDNQFCAWCQEHLSTTAFGARELLMQAMAAGVVPDERQWKEIGGLRAIRHVVDLPRRDQVAVLQAAKSQSRAPINIMRERGLIKIPEPKPAPRPAPNMHPIKPQPPKPDAYLDAVAMAQFIQRTSRSIPKDILAIVLRYGSFMRKAA